MNFNPPQIMEVNHLMHGIGHRLKRAAMGATFLLVALTLTSCTLLQQTFFPQDRYIEVTTRAKVPERIEDPFNLAQPSPEGARDEAETSYFEAVGRAELPISASGEVQRIAYARADARRRALRELAARVAQYRPNGKGQTLGELAGPVGQWRAALTDVLETRSEVLYENTQEEAVARARVPVGIVLEAMSLADYRPRVAPEPVATEPLNPEADLEKRRAVAFMEAMEEAREELREQVMRTITSKGRVSRLARNRPMLRVNVEDMLERVRPKEVLFPPNGTCEVTLTFDRQRLEPLVR